MDIKDITPLPIEHDSTSTDGRLAGCITIRVGQPDQPIVVLDHALIQRLEATFKEVAKAPGITGLVLASASERVFIAGADLKTIQGWTDDQLHRYLEYGSRVFGMLAEFPFPTVAAINGAALGGGLELAMHCDALVAAPSASGKPYPIGLPEASLSICPGWGGTNLLPARIDPAEAIRRTAQGKPMLYDEAVKAGMFDAVAPTAAELLATAKAWLGKVRTGGSAAWGGPRDGAPSRWIGHPKWRAAATAAMFGVEDEVGATQAAAAVIGAVRAGLEGGWGKALEAERRELVRLRNSPEGKAAIKSFFDKAAAPKK